MPQRSRKAKDPGPLDGARFVRPGFARAPEHELAFALGYPHVPVEAGAPPVRPAAARKLLKQRARELTGPGLDVLARELEAHVGAVVIAETLVEILEGYGDRDFHAWNRGLIQLVRWGLGFALLRCPAAIAAALRARLEVVCDRAIAARRPDKPRQVEQILDVVLHGAAGARRSGHRYEGAVQAFDLLHVHDDPAFVLDQVRRERFEPLWRPWARLAFLGGEPVVRHYARHWRKIRDGVDVRAFVRDFGRIRSPAVTRAIREIAATPASPAAADATAWLARH